MGRGPGRSIGMCSKRCALCSHLVKPKVVRYTTAAFVLRKKHVLDLRKSNKLGIKKYNKESSIGMFTSFVFCVL